MADADRVKDAAEAYIYGYPLVSDLKEVAGFVEGGGSLPMQAPYNAFASARRLLGLETRFVSPNNDTLYVGGQCDVRQGPLVLHVPDTHDRYYVLQFVDAWTNNFAYIGRRATGTAEAEYLLADRDYDGPVPDGVTVVAAPTGCSPPLGGPAQRRGRPAGRPRPPGPVHPHHPGSPYRRSGPRRGRPRAQARPARPRRTPVVGAVPGRPGGVPPARRRQAVRSPGRAARGDRGRVALCGSRPRAGRGAGRWPASGPGQARGAGQRWRGCAGRLVK